MKTHLCYLTKLDLITLTVQRNKIKSTIINPGNLKKPIKQMVKTLIGIMMFQLNQPQIKLYTYKNTIPINRDLNIFFNISTTN